MKCRFTNQQMTRGSKGSKGKAGIALVITLVMLAVVTVMAIIFLAVTRRERASVKVTEETALAKDMADAALERAKTEAMSDMNANGSRLHYGLFNSRAYHNKGPISGGNGYRPADGVSPTNVAHVLYWPTIRQGSAKNYLQMLGNLQYDPAVPVFVETNRNGQSDFRFYLDFNRNRQFETNGWSFVYDENFRPIDTNQVSMVGDPEWIGVLERPDLPHSETNRFVGRLAYLVLPAGKTLDLNFMHNQVNPAERLDQANAVNGYSRNQGVGSWEINLAAFLRELNGNTYAWGANNSYRFLLQPGLQFQAQGLAFDDARTLLSFRYPRRSYLKSMQETLGENNLLNPIIQPNAFQFVSRNYVDEFGDQPMLPSANRVFYAPNQPPPVDNDDPNVIGWPGSINTNAFTDLQQLFSVDATSPAFVARLQAPAVFGQNPATGRSTYDRYSFYRLAAQLGTDSTPALDGKIHLNFNNPIGLITNTTERWTNPIAFFTNAADLMLRASIDSTLVISNITQARTLGRPPGTYFVLGDTLVRTNFSLTNILVYATNVNLPGVVINEYTPTVHRILQVAANITDSMTNRTALSPYPYFPTVFSPIFSKVQGGGGSSHGIVITSYVEVTNNAVQWLGRTWADAELVAAQPANFGSLSNLNFYGQHMVIGAKKGFPNFNELALNSRVEFSRKISLTKQNPLSTNIIATNQMYLVGLEQRWGMEAWNSYTSTYPRNLTIQGDIQSAIALRDGTNFNNLPVFTYRTNLLGSALSNTWTGRGTIIQRRNMSVLIDKTIPLIPNWSYATENGTIPHGPRRFRGTNETDYSASLELPPEFMLYTTNKVRFWMLDGDRIVDFVSFDRLVTQMDLREQLRDGNSVAGTNQNRISYWDTNRVGNGPITVGLSNQLAVSVGDLDEPSWRNYRFSTFDKEAGISKFRVFLGLRPRTGIDTNLTGLGLRHQAPFTPTRQMIQRLTWQVNDPLVHYMVEDLRRNRADERPQTFEGVGPAVNNTNLWNIGLRNDWYHPWSGANDDKQDPFSWNVGLMDPGVRSSDHWEFLPTHTNFTHFPNIGALGQVHRGTPWQTLYLKSFYRQNTNTGQIEFFTPPSLWYDWAGTMGTHPSRDWRLLDVFTAAPNENAARGLLSVNQTNTAAWSAVLSGTIVATNIVGHNQAIQFKTRGVNPADAYAPIVIQPGTRQIAEIVDSINFARTHQVDIIRNPDPNANPNLTFIPIVRTNALAGRPAEVFRHMGEVLSAPALSVQSPFLNRSQAQVQGVWNDRAVEFLPQQILSLLQRDEPRFVVYAFGQSLKPAPRSLTTDPDYYHMCTNYQITGEVITKTTFRVEGRPMDPSDPLRPVVEKYEILPPAE